MNTEQTQTNGKAEIDVRTVTLRGPVIAEIDKFMSKYQHNSYSHCASLFANVGAEIFQNNPDTFFEILQRTKLN